MKKFFTLIAAAFALSASAQLADGDYFIKNNEAGKFLNGSNNWGTKASVTSHAQIMTIAANEGKFSIDSHYSNGSGRNFLAAGDNTYLDAAVAYHTIATVAGGYSIMDANAKYLTSDGTFANFNGDEAQAWSFLTKADYIAEAIAKAKAGELGDLTGLVPDANFSRNNTDFSKWTGSSLMGKGGPNNAMDATAAGMNAEKWGGNSTSIDFGTKIEGLPNGKYTLKFQGFYRYNNTGDNTNDIAAAAHADGTEKINSYFIANGIKVPFISVADEASVGIYGKMPFSQAEASEAFTKGAYQQELVVDVTDGTLSLKVEKLEADHEGCDWTIIDNIELYLVVANANLLEDLAVLLGNAAEIEDPSEDLQAAMAAAADVLDNPNATAAEIQAAIDALKEAMTPKVMVYTDLTKEMYHQWTAADASAEIASVTVYPAYDFGVSTGLPYGDGNVYYLNFADLSDYEELVMTSTEGAPRCCFNRLVDNGTVTVETPRDAAYFTETVDGGVKTTVVNLKKIKEDAGFVHLHCIKGANWANVTLTSAKLGKLGTATAINNTTVAAPAKVMKFIENGKVVLVKNGQKFNIAGQIVK